MNNTVAVIQARMGSTRLPGKVLRRILDRPVLDHLVERLSRVAEIDSIVIATSNKEVDDQIAQFCSASSIPHSRGSENDVLDRFYQAALELKARTVLRITGDCPLIDPDLVSQLVELYHSGNYDYCGIATGAGVANMGEIKRFPDGLDAEVMSMEILKTAWEEATALQHREHVTPFIWQHPDRFHLGTLFSDEDLGHYRWTLDEAADFSLINWIYSELYHKNPEFDYHDVVMLLKKNAEKLQDNNHLIGQEGYNDFWRNDDD